MGRYKINTTINPSDSGYDSEYESDGGTEYSPVKPIGKGGYAQARLFKSRSNKAVVVLNPVKADMEEARIKQRFFQTIYTDKQSPLFTIKNTQDTKADYRLVLPYIPHIPYNRLIVDTSEVQKILFRSAIEALKDCHDKEIIVVDLKSDDIYYDSSTQKSYLIDGGLSAPTGTPLHTFAFQKSNQNRVDECKREYWHIPPECWSVRPTSVAATPAMDVYALGILMTDILTTPESDIQLLIDSCLEKDPKDRPTLVNLLEALQPNLGAVGLSV